LAWGAIPRINMAFFNFFSYCNIVVYTCIWNHSWNRQAIEEEMISPD